MTKMHRQGIPSILDCWIHSRQPEVFEARSAVARLHSSSSDQILRAFDDLGQGERILEMLIAAHRIADAASSIEQQLSIEARSLGISLRDIGKATGRSESGVSNYLKRWGPNHSDDSSSRLEREAWGYIYDGWSKPVTDEDNPGESYFRQGVDHLLSCYFEFAKMSNFDGDGDHSATEANSRFAKSMEHLFQSLECFLKPSVPLAIEQHSLKILPRSEDTQMLKWLNPLIAYSHRVIFISVCAGILANRVSDVLDNDSGDGDGDGDGTSISVSDLLDQVLVHVCSAVATFDRPEVSMVTLSMNDYLRREHDNLLPKADFGRMIRRRLDGYPGFEDI